jgi:hypothetical protein
MEGPGKVPPAGPPSTGSPSSGSSPSGAHGSETQDSASPAPPRDRDQPLYFFPEREVTDGELRAILRDGAGDQRAWAVSQLLRYAQWEDIWTYVSRDEVREIFPALDLPDNLRQAWGRMLKVETVVG